MKENKCMETINNSDKIPEYDSTIQKLGSILPKLSDYDKKELVKYAEKLEKEEEESNKNAYKLTIDKYMAYIIINACFCAMFYTIAFCGPKFVERRN